ncbi:pullulanase X25 domain-containing protein [Arthrobacter psychrolactophilus]|nr:glycosidase [Arthrobacter psychrolactophilus]
MSIRDNTNRRLKEVLDIMAAGSWLEEKPNGGEVLAEATARVPFTKEESELLSGGIPRGHKNLTKATADLVKAGWITKGRSGWSITDNGLRATIAFNTVEKLADALSNGTLIPAGTPLPEKSAAKKPAAKKASPKAKPAKAAAAKKPVVADVVLGEQPASVGLAGDFGHAVGAENWDPNHPSLQMTLEESGFWQLTAELPAGQYSYKAVLNGSWDENYGAFGVLDGANHEFAHAGGPVTFRYDHATKDVLRAER